MFCSITENQEKQQYLIASAAPIYTVDVAVTVIVRAVTGHYAGTCSCETEKIEFTN